MKTIIYLIIILMTKFAFAQSDVEKTLKAGELLVNGLSFFSSKKSNSNSKNVESVCVKNKLSDKITFKLSGKDAESNEVKKELIIQKDGKECLFELPKGIYTYQIELSNKDIFKKGEYKFFDETTITVKED